VVHYKVPFDITEDEWHRISTMLTSDGYIISVDVNVAANVSMSAYKALYPPTAYPVTGGAIGFGPFEDEIAYVKDVKVIGSNGTILYSNPMTSDDLYYEFGVHENTDSVCLDGAKRDRLVWTGDFAHTARTLGTTTHRLDYIRGTVDFCFNRQASNGFVPVQAAMGSPPEPLPPPFFLQDYQLLFLLSIYDYYVQSADLNFVRGHWTNINAIISGMKLLIEPSTNLVGSSGFYFLGPGNGTAVTSLMVYTLRRTAVLATALGDTSTATSYTNLAATLSYAVQTQLWNPTTGTFALSLIDQGNFSVPGIAFSILSGIATPAQARSMLTTALPQLWSGVGYRDVSSSPPTEHISPNTNGFLLEAIFLTASNASANPTLAADLAAPAKKVLDGMWSLMVTQNQYYTGASWEYMYPDGSPGLDLFTSLSHPWGSAPSYVLPEYVLGVTATAPGFKTWQFKPFVYGLGLTSSSGRVETAFGRLEASWTLSGGSLRMVVQWPRGTDGVVVLPKPVVSYRVNRRMYAGKATDRVAVSGGRPLVIEVDIS